MLTPSRSKPDVWLTLLMLVLAGCMSNAFADPPSRVARLSVLRGDVSFAPAGEDNWYDANLNRPLVSGDQLYTDRDARAELDIGAATVRLGERSSFSILDLDDRSTQLKLTQGTLNLRVHKLYGDQRYEVDTPTLAFVISQPGEYRIDIASQGNATRVTVFDGAGDVFGENGARYRVDQRQSYRFNDSRLRDVAVLDLPRPDDFDHWCFARDEHYDNSSSRRYVSDEVIGAADLDEYGAWDDMPSYGSIWFPTRVDNDWAPYRSGHWTWIDPWGWTWVDNAPWGFAPFHYGRWVYVGNRWGWLPGPVALRPVYAPALVVFVGDNDWRGGYAQGGAPVGWCPLGPRDVYRPPYSVSRGYFTNINASNTPMIDRDRISSSYENYAQGRPAHDRDYTYGHNRVAVTAVSRETFVHARPVEGGRLHLGNEQLSHTEIVRDITPSPTAASLTPTADHTRATVPRENFNRDVITHSAPPPPAAPFAAHLRAIERNGGRPLTDNELHQLNAAQPVKSRDAAPQRARVVGPSQTPVLSPLPATITDVPRTKPAGAPVAPRDRSLPAAHPEPARDRRPPPSDNAVRQAPEAEQRVGRLPHEERASPAVRFAPPRDVERNTGQGAVERAPQTGDITPVAPRGANAVPASHPDNVRADDRRPPPVERRQTPPAAVIPRNAQQPPETGRERAERNKDAKRGPEDGPQEQGAPGR